MPPLLGLFLTLTLTLTNPTQALLALWMTLPSRPSTLPPRLDDTFLVRIMAS